MSDSQEDAGQSLEEGNQNPEFSIDPKLIEAWFKIPGDQPIEISLPRVMFDMLYVAIERSYFATVNGLRFSAAENHEEQREAYKETMGDVWQGLRAIREFQSLVMASVTGTKIDGDLRVIDAEERPDG